MYQLKVKIELQVEAPKALDPDEVETLWFTGLTIWLGTLGGFTGEVTSVEAVAILPEPEIGKHLTRYLVNIEKRTGQEWEVLKRYRTLGPDHGRYGNGYDRALLRAEDGSTVRIYYRLWRRCWVKGQPILKPKEVANGTR